MNQYYLVFIFLLWRARALEIPDCAPCTNEEEDRCEVVVGGPRCERIREPNCGCCMMCARLEGESCGVGVGECGAGLTCAPLPGVYPERDILLENSLGRFVCVRMETLLEEDIEQETSVQDLTGLYEPLSPPLRTGYTKEIPRPPYPNHMRPCSDHLAHVLRKKYFARHDWVPGCRENGKYLSLQCELTFGLVRGRCWCVNKAGRRRGGFVSQPFASECRRRNRHTS